MRIRVLTYNIHGGRGRDGRRDYGRIGRFLREQQIDVALIQELDARGDAFDPITVLDEIADDRFSTRLTAPTLTTDDGWYGNAILSRFPATHWTITDITHGRHEPRNILEARLETPVGPLHAMTTHKGLGFRERRAQLVRLHQLLLRDSDVPLIVGGDINEWQRSSASLRLLDRCLHPLATGATFPAAFPFFRLDRLWCRPATLARQWKVLKNPETSLYSDHLPLVADLELD